MATVYAILEGANADDEEVFFIIAFCDETMTQTALEEMEFQTFAEAEACLKGLHYGLQNSTEEDREFF